MKKTLLNNIENALEEIRPFLKNDGGDISTVASNLDGRVNVTDISSTTNAFAALMQFLKLLKMLSERTFTELEAV